ncbi:hypothetical protein [Actinomadura kijaniata]|uniref:hypothetical protein n=1 Tax=Actinomadura kijaniata TaxID=46161 RepID=UPI0031DD511E
MDELTTLRGMRADTPPMTPEAERAARLRLLAASPGPERRRRRAPRVVWRLGAVAALAAGAVVAAAVVRDAGSGAPGRPSPMMPVANVAELGERAARTAESDPGPVAGPRQWTYVRHAYAEPRRYGVGVTGKVATGEFWVDFTGGGMRTSNGGGGLRRSPAGSWADLTRYTATDPAALRRQLLAAARAERRAETAPGSGPRLRVLSDPAPDPRAPVTDADVFTLVDALMRLTAPPPRLQAALYRLLPRLEGARLRRGAADVTGRRGVAFTMVTDRGRSVGEIIVSEGDYRYLGSRMVQIPGPAGKDHRSRAGGVPATGRVVTWTALLAKGVVDRPGTRP